MNVRSDHKISSARRSNSTEKANESNNEILFMCPELADGVYPKHVWQEKVLAYIADKEALDRVRACIVAIKTFSTESEIFYSLKILRIYLSNLINYPNEPKFRKIRTTNPHLQKLRDVVGAIDFLRAIGFQERTISVKSGTDLKEESYLVHVPKKKLALPEVLQELDSVRGFTLSLFRNIIFIEPNTDPVPEEPDDFYEWTVEDMEREYQYRKKQSENNQCLRPKNLNREAVKVDSDYTIIRVRFPDGIIIQATFSTRETLADLNSLLRKNMEISKRLFFILPPSKKFSEVEENRTFLDLDLYPSVTLLVRCRPDSRSNHRLSWD